MLKKPRDMYPHICANGENKLARMVTCGSATMDCSTVFERNTTSVSYSSYASHCESPDMS